MIYIRPHHTNQPEFTYWLIARILPKRVIYWAAIRAISIGLLPPGVLRIGAFELSNKDSENAYK